MSRVSTKVDKKVDKKVGRMAVVWAGKTEEGLVVWLGVSWDDRMVEHSGDKKVAATVSR